ncbi:MAG TPA: hypothetical protein VNY08_15370 [Bradyrhizobium sp.]|nr:hypothetical protein [Bradyrhizobium sp.]
MLQFDHITIAAGDLAAGVAHAEAALGRSLRPFFDDPRVRFSVAERPSLSAAIRTPHGGQQLR